MPRRNRTLQSAALALVYASLFMTLLGACSQGGEEVVLEPLETDEISGDRLWQRITEESDYRNYGFWPGHEGLQPGQAPHGQYHKIYINKPLRSALPIEDKIAPNGSIIVKENISASEELTGYTVMAKVEGFNAEAGDWFWAKYAIDGTVQAQGAVGSCITCHAGQKSNDYIIVQPLDRAAVPE